MLHSDVSDYDLGAASRTSSRAVESMRDLVGLFVKAGLELFNLASNAARPDQLRDRDFVSIYLQARRSGPIALDTAYVLYSATRHVARHGPQGIVYSPNPTPAAWAVISRSLQAENALERPIVTHLPRDSEEPVALAYVRPSALEQLDWLGDSLVPRFASGGALVVDTQGERYAGRLRRDLEMAVPQLFWHRVGPQAVVAVC